MPFVVYRSEAENRDLLSDVCGENLVNKDYRVKMQIFIERLWGETYHKAYPHYRQNCLFRQIFCHH